MSSSGLKLPVMEIFGPTLQGEGQMIGYRTHFLRLGGCPYRCVWCDSMHAVDPELVHKNAKWMLVSEIKQALDNLAYPAKWVTLTGGDPVMWERPELIQALQGDYQIAVETEGFLWQDWLENCNHVTVSPKGPSSGMCEKTDWDILDRYYKLHRDKLDYTYWPSVCFKVVCFNREDLEFAAKVHTKYPSVPFYLSVGTNRPTETETLNDTIADILESARNLARDMLSDDRFSDARMTPQMHVLLWGHALGR